MEMLKANSTGYHTLPVQQIRIKSTVKENLKSHLFNSANHTFVASTGTEIEALKDRPFILEHHIFFLYTLLALHSTLKQSTSFELA